MTQAVDRDCDIHKLRMVRDRLTPTIRLRHLIIVARHLQPLPTIRLGASFASTASCATSLAVAWRC